MSKIRIIEMSARDGLQNEPQIFSPATRADFVQRLAEAGLRHIEVGAFVSPKWVPQMEGTDKVYEELRKKRIPKSVRMTALVPNLRGFADALNAGANDVAVFTAASEAFSKKNTNASVDESMARVREVMVAAKKKKIKVRAYISTCYHCPFEGRIKPERVVKLAEELYRLGAYEISIGDTIGAAVPTEVRDLNRRLLRKIPKSRLAMHFHDTRGTALANILQSLQDGITAFDSSLGGLGGCPYAPGAAGNVATENVVYMLNGMGHRTGLDLDALKQARDWISQKVNRPLRGANKFRRVPSSD